MASRILCKSMRMALSQSVGKKLAPSGSSKISAQLTRIASGQISSSMISTSCQLRASSEVSKKLSTFISEEIKLENDSRKSKSQNAKINGFDVKTEGPVVTLTKVFGGDENITITFNVNGSLDDEQSFEQAGQQERNENQPEPEVEFYTRSFFLVYKLLIFNEFVV